MTITIRIGESERIWCGNDERWINEQINRRRADGMAPCVLVRIQDGTLDASISTPTCGRGGGRGAITDRERTILNLWEKVGMNRPDFAGGNLIAFLKQLTR